LNNSIDKESLKVDGWHKDKLLKEYEFKTQNKYRITTNGQIIEGEGHSRIMNSTIFPTLHGVCNMVNSLVPDA